MLGAYTPDQGIHPNPPLSRDTHIAEQLPAACGDADENFAPVLGVALPFDHFELQKSIDTSGHCRFRELEVNTRECRVLGYFLAALDMRS
jgi:hypothetical protein